MTSSDFRGLHKLKDAAGNRFRAVVLLYDGDDSVRFGENMVAMPIRPFGSAKTEGLRRSPRTI